MSETTIRSHFISPKIEGGISVEPKETSIVSVTKDPVVYLGLAAILGATTAFLAADSLESTSGIIQFEQSLRDLHPIINNIFKGIEFLSKLPPGAVDFLDADDPAITQLIQGASVALAETGSLTVFGKLGANLADRFGWIENLPHIKRQAMLEGRRPLDEKENPDRIIIGSTTLVSDFANRRETADHLVIGIHSGSHIPAAFGETLDYHFPVRDFNSLKDEKTIKMTGLDRSKQLTFLCINSDNGLFYGRDAKPDLSPVSISSILRSIPQESLQGVAIDVVLPAGFHALAATTEVADELPLLAEELGININIHYPEQKVLSAFQSLVEKIKTQKTSPDDKVTILLAGEGGSEADKKMLVRFSQALRELDDSVELSLVDNDTIEGIETTDPDERKQLLEKILQESDLNIIYGDSDDGTTQVAELLIKVRKAERDQTVCILETQSAVAEAQQAGLIALSLYDLLLGFGN